jgi:hypothetical protein
MGALADQLMRCATRSETACLETIATPVDRKLITIEPAACSDGMRRRDDGFVWRLDSEWMTAFAEMVDVLAVSKPPAHQYLECGVHGEIEVMVSRDEYPDDLNPGIP